MSLQPSKSDQDFTKNLIANQDVLLSPSIEQQNEATLDFFSFINNDSLMLNIIEQSNNVNSNQDNELNLFDILPSDDPEVASLLESFNQSDFAVNFLPQISINTASKLLDDDAVADKKDENEEIYQIVQLKTECETPEQPASPASTTPVSSASTRTSQRLMNKKPIRWSRNEDPSAPSRRRNKKTTKSESRGTPLKRKRSLDDDDDNDSNYNSSESDSIDFKKVNAPSNKRFVAKHNDNSVDFESDDHIYYDDDDEVNEDNDYFHSDDDENEKDFKEYVREYNLAKHGRSTGQRIDPTKKESNKEAATRYRLKKLSEKERLFQTRMCLENENNEVKRKIEMASTEINYLKSLLVQMLLTKGMIDSKM